MKTSLVSLFLVLWTLNCSALMVQNGACTNTPPGDAGRKTQMVWNQNGNLAPTLATAIAPHYFVSDQHDDRPIGSTIMLGSSNLTVVEKSLTPSGNLLVYKTAEKIPANCICPIYTNRSEVGQELWTHGIGSPTGEVITTTVPLTITDFCHDTTDHFNVTGLGQFKVLCSSNMTDWMPMTNVYTAPCAVTLPCGQGNQMFYKLLVTSQVTITNGWKPGPIDGKIRSGKVLIDRIDPTYGLVAMNFNPLLGSNACANWSYDSSGGAFINEGGVWKFAGVIHGTTSMNLYQTSKGELLYGAMLDQQGLTLGYSSQAGFVPLVSYPITGVPVRTQFYLTRVSDDAAWLVKNFVGK